jgi:hypothetical protein
MDLMMSCKVTSSGSSLPMDLQPASQEEGASGKERWQCHSQQGSRRLAPVAKLLRQSFALRIAQMANIWGAGNGGNICSGSLCHVRQALGRNSGKGSLTVRS